MNSFALLLARNAIASIGNREPVTLSGKMRVHTDAVVCGDICGLKRKRVQPRGSKTCAECSQRRISANAEACAICLEVKLGIR